MNDVAGRKLAGPRYDRLSRRAAPVAITDSPALRQDGGAASAVDRPVNSASPQERRVRGVDDRVDLLVRDVSREIRDVSQEKGESNTVVGVVSRGAILVARASSIRALFS